MTGERDEVERRKFQLDISEKLILCEGGQAFKQGRGVVLASPFLDVVKTEMSNTLSKKDMCFYFTSYYFFRQSAQHIPCLQGL